MVALALAVVLTVGLVLGVRALLRNDDLRTTMFAVLVGLLAGRVAEIDLRSLLSRRLRLIGSVLRARSREEKAELVAAFAAFALPRLADGRLRPQVDRVVPFEEVADAYATLSEGGLGGKVILEMFGVESSPSGS